MLEKTEKTALDKEDRKSGAPALETGTIYLLKHYERAWSTSLPV